MTAITFHSVERVTDPDTIRRVLAVAAEYEARQAHLAALAAREQRRLDTMRDRQAIHQGRKPTARRKARP